MYFSYDNFRPLDVVNTVLEYAKLDDSDVKPFVQTIFFSEKLDNDAVKLLELHPAVMDSLETGDRYCAIYLFISFTIFKLHLYHEDEIIIAKKLNVPISNLN